MPTIPFESDVPKLDQSVFVAPDAWIIGKVKMGKNASAFFGSVLRGDVNEIVVGERTNIQDHAILHTTWGQTPCIVGNQVTVGHNAILHGSTVEDLCIIGMHATILDGAVIGAESIVGANSLVTTGVKIPPRSLVIGSPAKVVRQLKPEELEFLPKSAAKYCKTAAWYLDYFANAKS